MTLLPENVKTDKQKIQYLKDVYGIQGDLFNEIMFQVFENVMTECIGGESAMNEETYKDMIRIIEKLGLGE